jgi:hypothetical protein
VGWRVGGAAGSRAWIPALRVVARAGLPAVVPGLRPVAPDGWRAVVLDAVGFGLVVRAAGLRARPPLERAAPPFAFARVRPAGAGLAARRGAALPETERARTGFFVSRRGIHEVYGALAWTGKQS